MTPRKQATRVYGCGQLLQEHLIALIHALSTHPQSSDKLECLPQPSLKATFGRVFQRVMAGTPSKGHNSTVEVGRGISQVENWPQKMFLFTFIEQETNVVGYKSATKALLSKFEKDADFPGCYVFLDHKKPVYVGISRGLIKRLAQHLNHDSHYSASLVYKMATEDYQS